MYKHRQQRKEEQSFHPAIAAFYFANAQDTSAYTAHHLLQRDADVFARFVAINAFTKKRGAKLRSLIAWRRKSILTLRPTVTPNS